MTSQKVLKVSLFVRCFKVHLKKKEKTVQTVLWKKLKSIYHCTTCELIGKSLSVNTTWANKVSKATKVKSFIDSQWFFPAVGTVTSQSIAMHCEEWNSNAKIPLVLVHWAGQCVSRDGWGCRHRLGGQTDRGPTLWPKQMDSDEELSGWCRVPDAWHDYNDSCMKNPVLAIGLKIPPKFCKLTVVGESRCKSSRLEFVGLPTLRSSSDNTELTV